MCGPPVPFNLAPEGHSLDLDISSSEVCVLHASPAISSR